MLTYSENRRPSVAVWLVEIESNPKRVRDLLPNHIHWLRLKTIRKLACAFLPVMSADA
jgi:hypothetical protein